jgi:hypothetical protein
MDIVMRYVLVDGVINTLVTQYFCSLSHCMEALFVT